MCILDKLASLYKEIESYDSLKEELVEEILKHYCPDQQDYYYNGRFGENGNWRGLDPSIFNLPLIKYLCSDGFFSLFGDNESDYFTIQDFPTIVLMVELEYIRENLKLPA